MKTHRLALRRNAMRKLILPILLVIVLLAAGCSFSSDNKIKQSDISPEDEMLFDSLRDIVHIFEYEFHNDDYPVLNIWIDKYVNGEKQKTQEPLSLDLSEVENDAGKIAYTFDGISSVNEDEIIDVNLILNDAGGGSATSFEDRIEIESSEIGSGHGPVLREKSVSLSNDDEITLGVLAIGDSRNLPVPDIQPFAPENMGQDEYIQEMAGDVEVFYVMRAKFDKKQEIIRASDTELQYPMPFLLNLFLSTVYNLYTLQHRCVLRFRILLC